MAVGNLAIERAHIPVMLNEVLQALAVRERGIYVDCTVGGAGHARPILESSSPSGRLLGLDLDPQAIDRAAQHLEDMRGRFLLANENFDRVEEVAISSGFYPADGILFDLGVSSDLLEDPERGFSFQHDAPLDMRFDKRQQVTAADLANYLPERELADTLFRFSQERFSRRIARFIIANRPVLTTSQLAWLVERAIPARGRDLQRRRIHPATRTFMALRIAVNREFDVLVAALPQAVKLLKPGGRIAIISFHSLEDGLVKDFFRRESSGCLCPPKVPICVCGHSPSLRIITKDPVTPTDEETRANPRSRSAKLRVAERL
ncbi:MAG: 16S rRNA (cytosine(1402)-N(4))-methyltransferase RsmH [Dehalococcoidia bacterium]|nr:16S rRNA (cytosine(1402)-N(4))-methyltransferase RsmH [Dehalococcoidia bacterium]